MSRMLTVAAVGLALGVAAPSPLARVQAAGQARSAAAAPAAAAPDRALVDKYCVSCHNDKLKTGGFSFDNVNLGDVQANAETLEKMARKLRTGQMPPSVVRGPRTANSISLPTRLKCSLIAPPR
jgi:mono/diheme cytochrome c family protein